MSTCRPAGRPSGAPAAAALEQPATIGGRQRCDLEDLGAVHGRLPDIEGHQHEADGPVCLQGAGGIPRRAGDQTRPALPATGSQPARAGDARSGPPRGPNLPRPRALHRGAAHPRDEAVDPLWVVTTQADHTEALVRDRLGPARPERPPHRTTLDHGRRVTSHHGQEAAGSAARPVGARSRSEASGRRRAPRGSEYTLGCSSTSCPSPSALSGLRRGACRLPWALASPPRPTPSTAAHPRQRRRRASVLLAPWHTSRPATRRVHPAPESVHAGEAAAC